MPVDSRYKGNRTLKDAGQKPQNNEDKEYVEMIQQQTTFEADAEGGDFRYSEMYQNFDPEKKDYSDLEYTYPPFNPPPFDPWDPGPVTPKDDPPGGGEEDELVFSVKTQLCWCPKKDVTANVVVVPGRVISVRMSAMDRSKATVSLVSGGNIKIRGADDQESYQGSMTIVLTIQYVRAATETTARIVTTVEQTYLVPRCKECCDCSKTKISYVTLQVWIDSVSSLSLTDADLNCTYTWTKESGVGTLEAAEDGLTATYTAPADNSSCNGQAVISLNCKGSKIDEITIIIKDLGMITTPWPTGWPAGTRYEAISWFRVSEANPPVCIEETTYTYCICWWERMDSWCDGSKYGTWYNSAGNFGEAECGSSWPPEWSCADCWTAACGVSSCAEFYSETTVDYRNETSLKYGCCYEKYIT